jgi:hypothetical protein
MISGRGCGVGVDVGVRGREVGGGRGEIGVTVGLGDRKPQPVMVKSNRMINDKRQMTNDK